MTPYRVIAMDEERREFGLPARPARRAADVQRVGADRALVARERTAGAAEVEDAIDRLLDESAVGYVHVRSTSAGCFLCRLDRAA